MAPTKKSRDFLDKELFVKRNIVTFRSLSRELGIHVNDAKRELQLYCDAVRDTSASAVPTYLVSGEVPALKANPSSKTQESESAMDLDPEFEEGMEEVDMVHQTKILLVDARSLDEVKSQFSRIYSVHIYSLSPSRLGDAGLVCVPTHKVRQADAQGGLASFAVTGKITGTHVKLRTGAAPRHSAASSSKTTLDALDKATRNVAAPKETDQQTTKGKAPSVDTKGLTSTTPTLPKAESKDRPKPSGKLDWSKAKTKDKEPATMKIKEDKKSKLEPALTMTRKSSVVNKKAGLDVTHSPKSESLNVASVDAPKRGMKRKSQVDEHQDSETEPLPVKAGPSTYIVPKKELSCSDDEDEGEVRRLGQRRPKRKSAVTSDSEMSLRAMMDIDDELVDRVFRVSKARPQPEEVEESEESESELVKEATAPPATSEDEESDHVPVIQRKKKPRKVVPVGRNGLKKRRVVKSRMTTDAKGYMQTEDYSSYESVEEEEEEADAKPKGKDKGVKKASEPKAASKAAAKEEKLKGKSTPKPRGGASKRGGILNFFGPDKGKK